MQPKSPLLPPTPAAAAAQDALLSGRGGTPFTLSLTLQPRLGSQQRPRGSLTSAQLLAPLQVPPGHPEHVGLQVESWPARGLCPVHAEHLFTLGSQRRESGEVGGVHSPKGALTHSSRGSPWGRKWGSGAPGAPLGQSLPKGSQSPRWSLPAEEGSGPETQGKGERGALLDPGVAGRGRGAEGRSENKAGKRPISHSLGGVPNAAKPKGSGGRSGSTRPVLPGAAAAAAGRAPPGSPSQQTLPRPGCRSGCGR